MSSIQKKTPAFRHINGGITAVEGFKATGFSAGIKKGGVSDLALLFSEKPCTVAALFTKNRLPAAPLLLNKKHLKTGKGQAIIINSGNANAYTGTQGKRDAEIMAIEVARCLTIRKTSVYVASTGVIGESLPIDIITKAIPKLVSSLSKNGSLRAANAIRTTDTTPKEFAIEGRVGKHLIRIGGIAKGAGMIHPNMATLLAFLSTDVFIDPRLLQEGLKKSVDESFHRITIDGETSTNDMVLLFSNGKKGRIIKTKGSRFNQFVSLLTRVCTSLSKMLVKDAEGATKLVEIHVIGAKDTRSAKLICASVAKSLLVKTAFFGEDANWGRIIAAIGNAGVKVISEEISLSFGPFMLVKKGTYLGRKAESDVTSYLRGKTPQLTISLSSGCGKTIMWTSDLSLEYVKINALYRT